jgi:cellulase (glycosyl hydrolase family 5)
VNTTLFRRSISPFPLVLLAALAAMVSAFAALPRGAEAAGNLEIALQDDTVFLGQRYIDRKRAFRHARALGVTRLRVNANWAYSMPKAESKARRKPQQVPWTFAGLDSVVDAAAENGIRVHLSVTGPAPVWASGNRKISGWRPNTSYFGEFASALAAHFKGRVDRYSIWNEPNWRTWLGPLKNGPALYRSLYQRGYAAIKKADPAAKVLIGETSPYARPGFSTAPIAFLRSLACVNKRWKRVRRCPVLKADGYAHHPYDLQHAPNYRYPGADNATMGTLSNLTRAIDRIARTGALRFNGGGRMPLYLTEFGYLQDGHRSLPPKQRSRYLAQAFGMALKNGRVKSQLHYLLVSPPKNAPGAFFNTALMRRTGAKYPQYRALQRWYQRNRGRLKRPGAAIALPPASAG